MRSYSVHGFHPVNDPNQKLVQKNEGWFIVDTCDAPLLQIKEDIATRISYALDMMEPVRSHLLYLEDVPFPKYTFSSLEEDPYYHFVRKSNCHGTALETLSEGKISTTPWESTAKPIIDEMGVIGDRNSFFRKQKRPCILFDKDKHHSIVLLGMTDELHTISFEKMGYNHTPFVLKKSEVGDLEKFTHFYQPDKSQ